MDASSPDIKSIMESVSTPPISQFENLSPDNIKANDIVSDAVSGTSPDISQDNPLYPKNITEEQKQKHEDSANEVIRSLAIKAQELADRPGNETNKEIYRKKAEVWNDMLRFEDEKRQQKEREQQEKEQTTKRATELAHKLIDQITQLLEANPSDTNAGIELFLANVQLSLMKSDIEDKGLISIIDSIIDKARVFYSRQFNNTKTPEQPAQNISDLTPGVYNVTINRDQAGTEDNPDLHKVPKQYQAEVVVLTQDDEEVKSKMIDPNTRGEFRAGDKVVRLSGDYTYTIDSIEWMDENLTGKSFNPIQKETVQT